ncbi:MAG: hypothetical protein HFF56_05965 [Lawsonibacter sp.]|nr:hypothetical protein [Lawsonibacter sp.]
MPERFPRVNLRQALFDTVPPRRALHGFHFFIGPFLFRLFRQVLICQETENAVQYAIEAERLKMLIAAKDAKDLQEFIAYLEKLILTKSKLHTHILSCNVDSVEYKGRTDEQTRFDYVKPNINRVAGRHLTLDKGKKAKEKLTQNERRIRQENEEAAEIGSNGG